MVESLKEFPEGYEVILYLGEISSEGYEKLTETLEGLSSGYTKAYFVPVTAGGDPNKGYRIGRALGHYFPDDVRFFVPDVCKSAGTLIAMGSKELIISDRGELGPLDIQLAKKEELFEMSSGLDIIQALQVLQDTVKSSFRSFLFDLRVGANLSTKIAAELASEMASNLVKPISSQIDPIKLGEHQRALRIATTYGNRLNQKFKNTKTGSIDRLATGYPTHSFIIDRKEAGELFANVRSPNDIESAFETELRSLMKGLTDFATSKPIVLSLRADEESENENDEQDNGAAEPANQAE